MGFPLGFDRTQLDAGNDLHAEACTGGPGLVDPGHCIVVCQSDRCQPGGQGALDQDSRSRSAVGCRGVSVQIGASPSRGHGVASAAPSHHHFT